MLNKTQGLSLFFQKSASLIVKCGRVVDVSNFGGTRTQIDTTDTDDTEEMQFIAGLKSPGQITVNLNADFDLESQEDLEALYDSGESVTWFLGMSDGTSVPTVAADVFTIPDTRTFIQFEGFIADMPIGWAKNDIGRGTLQVQRSGVRTIHRKA